MGVQSALYTILNEKIKQDAIVLPTLPEIALKVRNAADDPNVDLNMMSHVISQDPALSLNILKMANSALLGGAVKVDTLNQAVTRIGLRHIKSTATAMAVSQMYSSRNKVVEMYLRKTWKKTVDVAAVSIALMSFYERSHKQTPMCVHTITLGALIHNIGVLPILIEAEKHPHVFKNPTFIQEAIVRLSSKIGTDMMSAWGFSDEYSEVVSYWSDLTFFPESIHYVDFIRAGAVYQQVFKNENTRNTLINKYIAKGVIPHATFMDTLEFVEVVDDVKAMFHH